MRLWPFGEHEERSAYTDTVTEALIAAASNNAAAPPPSALAAVEIAAGLWARSFASATVTPETAATRALTPPVLASIGRGLALRGEAVFAIDVFDRLLLTESSSWEIAGGTRPEFWTYAAEFPVTGGSRLRRLPSEAVVHVRYATRPAEPWKGVSPLGQASETRELAAWIERRLREEAATTTGYTVPVPDGATGAQVTSIKNTLSSLAGKLFIFETTAKGWGRGDQSAPSRKDLEPSRLGADPPSGLVSLRGDVRTDVLSAYGIPGGFTGAAGRLRGSLTGSSSRRPYDR